MMGRSRAAVSRSVGVPGTAVSAKFAQMSSTFFRVLKCRFGYRKVRYRGLVANPFSADGTHICGHKFQSLLSNSTNERSGASGDVPNGT
jgi:hypothetical protein